MEIKKFRFNIGDVVRYKYDKTAKKRRIVDIIYSTKFNAWEVMFSNCGKNYYPAVILDEYEKVEEENEDNK